jgi:hypothetical protein
MSAILALRTAIRAALVADSTLTGLTGGPGVWDERPLTATPPFLTFGRAQAGPSQAGPGMTAHRLDLVAWSQQGGDAEALGIAQRVATLLDDAPLSPEGHRLVLLRVRETQVGRPDKQGLRRATVTLDALTEAGG